MLQEIIIAGHSSIAAPGHTLSELLDSRPGELHAVVITNRDSPCPVWVGAKVKSVLHLVFDDINQSLEGSTRVPPSRSHLEEVVKWAEDKDHVVVACHAGVSRSSATAFLIASRAWGVDRALAVLKPGRHWPNPLMVKTMGDMFPGEGLTEAVSAWTDGNLNLLVVDEDIPLCDGPVEVEVLP